MSKFAKKTTNEKVEKKEPLWTNDPELQNQETGETTEKGAKFKKEQAVKTADREAKAAPKKAEKAAPKKAEKAAPKKAEKAAPKKAEKASDDTRKITVVAKENPKRGGAAERFALYKTGMTVNAYIKAGGKASDVAWDSKQGFIKVA